MAVRRSTLAWWTEAGRTATVIATCATISAVQDGPSFMPAPEAAKCCRLPYARRPVAFSAGTRPTSAPPRSVNTPTYASSPGDTPRWNQNGAPPWVSSCSTQPSARPASDNPTTAATAQRTSASTNSCVTTRPRLAPSAVRTAISAVRVAVRAYTSAATFEATTTSSRLAPSWSRNNRHVFSGSYAVIPAERANGMTVGRRCPCVSGYAAAMRCPIAATWVRACSSVTPSARRPNTSIDGPAPKAYRDASSRSGIQKPWLYGKRKPSGNTPTTVYTVSPNRAARPTTFGSPPK
jgi:hypothetical protein